MSDSSFDADLVTAAFALGAEKGWRHVSAAAAARHGGLDLAQARMAFPSRGAILRKFGRLADAAALTDSISEGSVRDNLFDSLLRRFDFLQAHRAGVIALVKFLPACPPLALLLLELNLTSMGWLLEGAGVDATGLRGAARKRGLLLVWGYGMRAWLRDESEDLSATMAAVDTALARAESFAVRYAPSKAPSETGEAPSDARGEPPAATPEAGPPSQPAAPGTVEPVEPGSAGSGSTAEAGSAKPGSDESGSRASEPAKSEPAKSEPAKSGPIAPGSAGPAEVGTPSRGTEPPVE